MTLAQLDTPHPDAEAEPVGLDRAPGLAEQVRDQRAQVRPARSLLTLLVAIPWALGWLAGATSAAVLWSWAAMIVGFDAAFTRADSSGRAGGPARDGVRS